MKQESSTKPANNKQQQNLIMVLLLAAVVGLLIFKRGQAPQVSSQADQKMRIEALQSKIKSYETILTQRGVELPPNPNTLLELSKSIAADLALLQAEVVRIQGSKQGNETALIEAQSQLQAALTTNQSLSTATNKLQQQLQQARAAKTNATAHQQELAALKATLAERDQQIEELQKRPAQETVSKFRASLNETMLTNEKLSARINELEAQLGPQDLPIPAPVPSN